GRAAHRAARRHGGPAVRRAVLGPGPVVPDHLLTARHRAARRKSGRRPLSEPPPPWKDCLWRRAMAGMKITLDSAMRARDVSRPQAHHEDGAQRADETAAARPRSARTSTGPASTRT